VVLEQFDAHDQALVDCVPDCDFRWQSFPRLTRQHRSSIIPKIQQAVAGTVLR
jgi:hypothetical protein